MKCFYHHDRDAIGTCKSCQRGLCPECAVEFPQGLACRGRCEEDTQKLIQLIQSNIRLSPTSTSLVQASRRSGVIAAGFNVVIGLLFAGWGFYDHMNLLVTLGIVFSIFGMVSLVRAFRLAPPKGQP